MSSNTIAVNGDCQLYKECSFCERRAVWVCIFSCLALTLFKVIVGFISGSKAILGDALYSFKDFIISIVVMIGMRVSGRPADERHPYGYGKVEFLAILFMSIFIIIAAVFLFIHSIKDIMMIIQNRIMPPTLIAFWAALISMVAYYRLTSYINCVGERVKSPVLKVNAMHSHSDAITSALVAMAVLGTNFGIFFLDPFVAIIETLDLIRLSSKMLNDSLNGIMDTQVNGEIAKKIESIALLVPGVRKVSKVVTRQSGSHVYADMAIKIDPHKTHEEGYLIMNQVRDSILKRVNNVTGVNLSFEPYFS
jgi:cation diffusion facilitator family transporter